MSNKTRIHALCLAWMGLILPGWVLADEQLAREVQFEIPAQRLSDALIAFSDQSGIQVVTAGEDVSKLSTAGVFGRLTISNALSKLLNGTPLAYAAVGQSTVALVNSSPQAATAADRSFLTVAQAEPARNAAPGEDRSALQGVDRNSLSTDIQEIIVTASKRVESIMSVPMSVAALDAAAIASRGLVNLDDFLRSVPAVAYQDQGPGQNIFIIRGAYGEPFSTGPTVGVYFGDIPLGGLALGASVDVKLIDMDRVEVLRGPQGTLYGSNSLSGTIRHIPTAPKLDRFDAHLTVGYSSTAENGGTNNEIQGVVNIPLVQDRLALRAVGYRIENEGFIKNIAGDDPVMQAAAAFFSAGGQAGNQDHVGGSSIDGARVALLWEVTDDLRLGLTYVHQNDSADDRPFAQRGFAKYERSTYRFGPIVGDDDAVKIGLDIANLTADYRVPWGTFFSSTAYVDQDARRLWDIGVFTPVSGRIAPMPQDSVDHGRLFTEELRFTSSFAGPFQAIAGIFYENSGQPTRQTSYYTGNLALNPIAPGAAEITSFFLDRLVEQRAVFGEAAYAITDKLKLIAGARFFDYDTTFTTNRDRTANPITRPLSAQTTDSSESGTTFKASVEYKIAEKALAYATFSQGFRLGRPKATEALQSTCDLNHDGLIDGTQLSSTDPLITSDSLDNYEVGAKATLFGGRATLRASGYHNNWKDLPVTIGGFQSCILSSTFNAGKVKADGFEVEGALNIASAVQVDFGLGYVNSKLAVTTSLGPEGARMNNAPKTNGHLGAEYRFAVAGRDSYARGDYSYYGDWYSGLGETGTKFDAYGLLDLSAGMRFERIDIRAYVDNVTGKYAITSFSSYPANGIYLVQPRTVGVRVGVAF